jgi:outer membrane protein TolC
MGVAMVPAGLAALLALAATEASAQALTAEGAVRLALQNNAQVIGAEAGVLEARGGLYGAFSGILPRFSADLSRSGQWTDDRVGNAAFGGIVFPPRTTFADESYATQPSLSGSWSLLNLSSITGWNAARSGLRAARQSRQAARNDVALGARRQFYEVVRTIRLAEVSSGALRLARDDERRVRALFEVGSVSRSDLLTAQVRTSQSELDSLLAHNAVTVQRIALANLLGVRESELGEVDTVLSAAPVEVDEGRLVEEAARSRPELLAAEADVAAARSSLNAARFARLPYVTVSGSASFNSRSAARFEQPLTDTVGFEIPGTRSESNTRSETERSLGARISVSWDFFDGLATDGRIASARGRLMRAQETRDALRRNLESEVRQAVLAYREALERDRLARRTLESATENLKLNQEKYNVGSATILELIDAQVQLQRAQSDVVSALAAIRVAEAQLNRVRGRAE